MSQPPAPPNPQNQHATIPDGTTAPGGATGTAPTATNGTIGAAIAPVPPAPTTWAPFLPNPPPLAPWPAAMEIDAQSAPRGGGATSDQQNAAFASIMSMFAPAGQPSMFDPPPPPPLFPFPPIAPPGLTATPLSVGPTDAWRSAYGATMQAQQVLQERVTELSNRNAFLEQEASRLRQEMSASQRRLWDQDRVLSQREIDLAHREAELFNRQNEFEHGRYHPFRRPSPSHSVDGRRNREYRPHGPSLSSPSTTSSMGAPSNSTSPPGATPARGPTPSATNLTMPAASSRSIPDTPPAASCSVSQSNQADTMNTDNPRSDTLIATGSNAIPAARRDPTVSSEFAQLRRPDPSLTNDPLSAWGRWYQTPGSTYETAPMFGDERMARDEHFPQARLPAYAQLLMGPEAEAREDERLRRARIDADMGRSVRTPSRDIQLASDLGPWGAVIIETANQAQNVRHAAVVEGDIYTIRFVRDYNRIHQDRTIRRTEGGRLLMRAFPSDSRYLRHESGDTARSRRNTRSRTQNTDEDENEDELDELLSDEIHAGPSSTATASSTPSSSSPIHRVSPATTVAEAWSIRAFAGRQRQLDPLDESLTLVNAFAALPTSEWPIAMRDNNGEFPPRGDDVRRIPLVDDVRAETFLTRLLPVVPADQPEQYGESAFFRGLIELFSLRGAYDWFVARGEYTQLLEDPPAPFPFDCTDLALHHVAAWAASHGIDQIPMLRELVTIYAINTRRRIEQQPDSTPITAPFRFAPARTADVTPDHHASLIPIHNTLFNGPHCSYGSSSTEDVTMASEHSVPETTNS